jgi:NADH dehydrogenase (ubiquinone) 1 alpha subcomplex subunit 13
MATTAKCQDMPPEGGYKPINYARIPAKKYFTGKIFLVLL